MRALVLDDALELRHDYPTPDLPHSEALVRVRQAGICATDLELIKGYARFRGVLGHEFVGVVEQCPSDPRWVGRRVVGEINVTCGICPTCRAGRPTHCPSRTALGIRGRDGAFADFLTLPVQNLHSVPDNINDDQAVFVEPLAAALAVTDQVHLRPSDRAIILGDGKLGQLVAQVLALTACDLTVVGHHEEKLHLLTARGINTYLVTPSSGEPEMEADVVVDATGTATGFATASHMLRPRGTLVLKSTFHGRASVDVSKIVVNEIHVIGSRCGPFAPALRLLAQGLVDVEPLIQARFSMPQGVLALEIAGERGMLKALIEM